MFVSDYSTAGGFGGNSSLFSGGATILICIILAVVGGIVLQITFLSKKKENKYTGFVGFLYRFLNFKELLAEILLKVIYTITSLFITIYSIALLFTASNNVGINLIAFLSMLVIGNAVVRLVYEFLLLSLIICRNTTEINRKLGPDKEPEKPNNTAQQFYEQPIINQPYQQQEYQKQPPSPQPQPQYEDLYQYQDENTSSVAFCRNCGQQYDSRNASCPYCGVKRD